MARTKQPRREPAEAPASKRAKTDEEDLHVSETEDEDECCSRPEAYEKHDIAKCVSDISEALLALPPLKMDNLQEWVASIATTRTAVDTFATSLNAVAEELDSSGGDDTKEEHDALSELETILDGISDPGAVDAITLVNSLKALRSLLTKMVTKEN